MKIFKANVTLNKDEISMLIKNKEVYISDVHLDKNSQEVVFTLLSDSNKGYLEYVPVTSNSYGLRNQKLISDSFIKDDETNLKTLCADKINLGETLFYRGSSPTSLGNLYIKGGEFGKPIKKFQDSCTDETMILKPEDDKIWKSELEKRMEAWERCFEQLEKSLDDSNQHILALKDYFQDKVDSLSHENMQLNEKINLLEVSKEDSFTVKNTIEQLLSSIQSDINNIYSIVSKLETEKEDKVAVEYIANHVIPQISLVMHQELDKISDILNLKIDKSEYTVTTGNDYLSKLEDKLETKLIANKLKNNVLEDKLINQLYDENTEEEDAMSETAKKTGEITGESSGILLKSLEEVLSQYSDIISVNRIEDDEE